MRHYEPPSIVRLGNQLFGHAFQAWTVYQRIVLRLPYRIIAQVTEHLFGVGLSASSGINFLRYLADYYAPTEAANLQAILKSDFIHVDETKINIEGVDHYVWVFTDGQHVVFRMTETREADIVREVLAGYQGVLVSDFYPGYDSIPMPATEVPGPPHPRHQRRPLEGSVRQGIGGSSPWRSRALLVPILEAVDRFGLKAWHLRKFLKEVERFYTRTSPGGSIRSEPAADIPESGSTATGIASSRS